MTRADNRNWKIETGKFPSLLRRGYRGGREFPFLPRRGLRGGAELPSLLTRGLRGGALVLLFALTLLVARSASAQVATGMPPFGSFSGGPIDVVDNSNLNVHIQVPVINKAGRGMPFNYALTYDSSIWSPVNSVGQSTWTPLNSTSSTWGWGAGSQAMLGYVSYYTTEPSCVDHNGKQYYYEVLSSWAYYDAQGTGHAFPSSFSVSNESLTPCVAGTYPPYSGSSTTTDGSGWQISVTAGALGFPAQPTATEYSVSGVAFAAPFFVGSSNPGSLTDANGNVISYSGGTFTDTLGSTALTIAGLPPTTTYTYTGPGSASTVTVRYTQKTVQTNFGCSGISEYGPSPIYLVSEIDLPDQYSSTQGITTDRYLINYEKTYNFPNSVTGRIASITLPTGGTISYLYAPTQGPNDINCNNGGATIVSRTTPDGTWTYELGSVSAPEDSQGNYAYTTFQFQGIYETERDVYTTIGGTLLETVNTCYNSSSTSCNGTAVTLPITQRTVTTTMGGLKSQVQTFYNGSGLVTKVDEYD